MIARSPVVAVALLLLAGCASVPPPAAPSPTATAPSTGPVVPSTSVPPPSPVPSPVPAGPLPTAPPASAPTRPADFARIVRAGGQRQWISCVGVGAPTVVIVSGLGAGHTMWAPVLPRLDALGRTCVYDRPGLGASPARVGPTRIDAGTHARELWALLRAVGEPGPYLLVGHSYGALVVRAFARAFASHVAAVLLLEGVYPGIQADYWAPYRHDWHEGGTVIDMAASARADGDGPRLGRRPLVVVTAADPEPGAPAWVVALWDSRQSQAAALSSDSVHVVALHSGHVVQHDQPAVVLEAVRELLAAVRHGSSLPRCSPAWRSVGARCLRS